MSKESRLIKQVRGRTFEPKTQIATDMFLPNHSGIKVHPEAQVLRKKIITARCLPQAADCYATTDIYGDIEIPFNCLIDSVGAYVDTAGTTGTMVIDLNKNGSTMMTANKISIDTGEKSSKTAATAAVLTTTEANNGDIITVDIDSIHTTAAKGLTIVIEVREK